MIDIINSTFRRIIVHRIYQKQRDEDYATVDKSTELINADDEVIDTLKDRINEACGRASKSFELEIAQIGNDSFFNHAKKVKDTNEEEFIETSGFIAEKLAESQTSMNIPGGFLIIIDGIFDNKNFVISVKAEPHDAFTTTFDENHGINSIELVKDIFLSPAVKFYKIGLIYERFTNEPDFEGIVKVFPNTDYSCLLFDDQFRPGSIPSEYFYSSFLGFSIDKNDKIQTKRFHDEVVSLIIKNVRNYEEKKELIKTIQTVIKNDITDVIDPMEIGERYFDEDLRRKYSQEILTNFPRKFVKNNILIERALTKKKITFPNKVKIEAPEETFDENIKVITNLEEIINLFEGQNGHTFLTIKGKPYAD